MLAVRMQQEARRREAPILSGCARATRSIPSTRAPLGCGTGRAITAHVAKGGMRGSTISRGRVWVLFSVVHWPVWVLLSLGGLVEFSTYSPVVA